MSTPSKSVSNNAALLKDIQSTTIKEKLQQRRRTMQQVRTNSCSIDTLQNISNMDPKLQSQVLNQVRTKKQKQSFTDAITSGAVNTASNATSDTTTTKAKPKPKARPKRLRTKPKTTATKSTKKKNQKTTATVDTDESVTQSTQDTNDRLQQTQKGIIFTAFEKVLLEAITNAQDLVTDEQKQFLSSLQQSPDGIALVQQFMNLPETQSDIIRQIQIWGTTKTVPTLESIKKFVHIILDRFMKIKNPSFARTYRFNHDIDAEISVPAPDTIQIDPNVATNLTNQSSITQLSTTHQTTPMDTTPSL
jgi:hypothetical protein